MNIRKMTINDASAVSKILQELGFFAHFNEVTEEESQNRIRQHIALCLSDDSHALFVAENPEGDVIGYTAVHWVPYLMMLKGADGYVSELFITESERGKGIGSKLLDVVKEEAKKRGCSRLSLLNIRHRESYQRGFYKKHGWTERPEVANFIYPFA